MAATTTTTTQPQIKCRFSLTTLLFFLFFFFFLFFLFFFTLFLFSKRSLQLPLSLSTDFFPQNQTQTQIQIQNQNQTFFSSKEPLIYEPISPIPQTTPKIDSDEVSDKNEEDPPRENGVSVENAVDLWGERVRECDLYSGTWVRDEENHYPIYKPGSCPYVDEAFDCQTNGRSDHDYLKWRWKPHACDLPRCLCVLLLHLSPQEEEHVGLEGPREPMVEIVHWRHSQVHLAFLLYTK
ncbi:hypothetical protein TIFTF001_024395 [Ficus carica]|uniref:Trichome birefringence-like N-terminal domain-containing protein n=1 Tax=Ficus carica TaxID=3494 RepID=A0AA88DGU6_FICCA|nr:hypothetical protein TIFTF001_024395 [Ficus carica]